MDGITDDLGIQGQIDAVSSAKQTFLIHGSRKMKIHIHPDCQSRK